MDGKELEYKGEAALQELEMLTMNAKEVQEKILTEILERNKTTEYLSKYMKGSTDISLFKRNVPVVTYDVIQPYILRIANGEDSSIISGHPITELIRSSGTSSGDPRLMPSIEEDLDRRTYLYNLIMPIMNKYAHEAGKFGTPWAVSQVYAGAGRGQGDVPPLREGGVADPLGPPRALGPHQLLQEPPLPPPPPRSLQRLHEPDAAILCADSRQSMYCQLLAGVLHRRRVLRLGAVFASALLRSLGFLHRHWPDLAGDVRTGSLNPSITDPACRAAMGALLRAPNPSLAGEIEEICGAGSWRGILGGFGPTRST
uniref:Uncharacterized protein n=1 Tax=Ananas comosus var. bracteatus TaxID=296719 RepID=A0A6V7PR35_ANACO|nr:unnamed protein product [Ananas comosus var. bracteatus]